MNGPLSAPAANLRLCELVSETGRYRILPCGPVLTKLLALLESDSPTEGSYFLVTGRQLFGAILLEVSQESKLARSTMVLTSQMP